MKQWPLIVLLVLLTAAGCAPANSPAADGATADSALDPLAGTPYAPALNPDDFAGPLNNPYMPLIPGVTRVYESRTDEGVERIEVTVLPDKREVMGIAATVVRDTVTLDGVLVEDTYDWFAQDAEGNVWYLGEAVDNYENGVLVDHHGSWEAGVDGAQPGIVMFANPLAHAGEPYRQEYFLGEAEDMSRVVGATEPLTLPYGAFDDVVQTEDWTPLEPDLREHKFYARGVGLVKEVNLQTGETAELISVLMP